MNWLTTIYETLLGPDVVIAPPYLAAFLAIAYLVYRLRRTGGGFWTSIAPAGALLHRSSRVDLQLFVIGRIMAASGLMARLLLTPFVAALVAQVMPWSGSQIINDSPILLALLFWFSADFATYWAHRLHHENRLLWPLHAVHHSAEVLTPLTAYRTHPLSAAFTTAFQSATIGAILGVIIGVVNPDASIAEIAGINTFYVAANLLISNFHHTHIWLSFGPRLEHLFISPAQHQIHHSTEPRHFNRNYGNTLAIWDWLFGTLYVIRGPETVTFGLTDPSDAPLMTHRLGPILMDPIWRILRRG